MSSSIGKPAPAKGIPVQVIVFAEIIWAVLALLFFLLFSVSEPGQDRDNWYLVATAVFEIATFFSASILCLRNWLSPQIVSGRKVWLGIGLGMLSYGIGSILFTLWEVGFGQDPDVSPGDFFYVITYIFLGWGMVMALISRRLNLEIWQWAVVTTIAIVGMALATWITIAGNGSATSFHSLLIEPVSAQTAPLTAPPRTPKAIAPPASQSTIPQSAPAIAPNATPAAQSALPEEKPKAEKSNPEKSNAPAWVLSLGEALKPLKTYVNFFYVCADVIILIIATTLLLAFWGGRFSQSWRMIAAAAFSLYIADMWQSYAISPLNPSYQNYQSGGLLEVFWVFSGVLFGIGAALEFDLSRSRRSAGSRRRAA